MIDYLKAHYAEKMPQWLKEYRKGGRFPLASFLASRIVYYPGSGIDRHPLETFGRSGSAHCFVMADYLLREEELLHSFEEYPLEGYAILDSVSLGAGQVLGAAPYRPHLTEEELCWAQTESRRFDPIAPYARMLVFEKQVGAEGPDRLAVLFLAADAIATYDALFANGNARPFGMLLQDHGFGCNWDRFGRGGLLDRIAGRSGVRPELLLSEEYDGVWEDYELLPGEPSVGGMHGNYRRLFVHRMGTEADLLRARRYAENAGLIGAGDPPDAVRALLSAGDIPAKRIVDLLILCPELASAFNRWELITDEVDWFRLVVLRPQFAVRCPCNRGWETLAPKTHLWHGASGPIAVVPLKKDLKRVNRDDVVNGVGRFPTVRRVRLEGYESGYGLSAVQRLHDLLSINNFSAAYSLDGEGMGADGDSLNSTEFVKQTYNWFCSNESETRLLYLEYVDGVAHCQSWPEK